MERVRRIYHAHAQILTSMGERNVTVTFIGPALMTYIERVGVICTFVTVETFRPLCAVSFPSQA